MPFKASKLQLLQEWCVWGIGIVKSTVGIVNLARSGSLPYDALHFLSRLALALPSPFRLLLVTQDHPLFALYTAVCCWSSLILRTWSDFIANSDIRRRDNCQFGCVAVDASFLCDKVAGSDRMRLVDFNFISYDAPLAIMGVAANCNLLFSLPIFRPLSQNTLVWPARIFVWDGSCSGGCGDPMSDGGPSAHLYTQGGSARPPSSTVLRYENR